MHILENLESRVLFAIGAADRSFGTAGQIVAPSGDVYQAIVVQKNHEFVVAGLSGIGPSTHAFVERFHPNGKPDVKFATQGRLDLDGSQFFDILSLALAPKNEIVVIASDGSGNDVLARLNARGALDSQFGTSGIMALPPGMLLPASKVEPDGSIAIVADQQADSPVDPPPPGISAVAELMHFTRAGQPDAHFGANGVVTTNLGPGYRVGDFELPGNGKIEVLFYLLTGSVTTSTTALQRFNANGDFDPMFDQTQGVNISPLSANRFSSDGSILSLANTSGTLVATRFTGAGMAIPFFGNQGQATLSFVANGGNSTDRAVVESGFKLLIIDNGAQTFFGGLTATGKIDKRFGRDGVVPVSLTGTITAVAGNGSRLIVLDSSGTTPNVQTIVGIKI